MRKEEFPGENLYSIKIGKTERNVEERYNEMKTVNPNAEIKDVWTFGPGINGEAASQRIASNTGRHAEREHYLFFESQYEQFQETMDTIGNYDEDIADEKRETYEGRPEINTKPRKVRLNGNTKEVSYWGDVLEFIVREKDNIPVSSSNWLSKNPEDLWQPKKVGDIYIENKLDAHTKYKTAEKISNQEIEILETK